MTRTPLLIAAALAASLAPRAAVAFPDCANAPADYLGIASGDARTCDGGAANNVCWLSGKEIRCDLDVNGTSSGADIEAFYAPPARLGDRPLRQHDGLRHVPVLGPRRRGERLLLPR
ncbi:MAG: hypothetical protein GY898_32355 [Proteobacteria bacterium]|nr:hypothetical protein [Pseudomonadota bacterium]